MPKDLILLDSLPAMWYWHLVDARQVKQVENAMEGLDKWYAKHPGQTPAVYISERMETSLGWAITRRFAGLQPPVVVKTHPQLMDAAGMWFAESNNVF